MGVPVSEITAKDFMMVRAALVKRLGGANEALVWARVFYRCEEDSRAAHDTEDGRWWAAPYSTVAAETGLTAKQARSALEALVEKGFLLREQHALRNNYDRVYSYQPVVLPGITDVPAGADGSAQTGSSHLPSGANHHLPSGANVPSIETLRKVPIETSAIAAAETSGHRFAGPLCEVLAECLRRNEAKIPSPMSKKWLDAARLLVDRDGRDPHQAKDLILWATSNSFWRANILSMPTFREQYDKLRLHAERETKKPVATVAHGRSVDELLAARESGQLAVSS